MEVKIGGEASALVGRTPLVRLGRLGADAGAEVVAKLEYFKPGRLGQGPARGGDDRRRRA
jgi:hypothetical protein